MRQLSRRQKYRVWHATIDQLESRWQCKTCTDVIEHDDAIYCRHCRMYWEDCANGLFDNADDYSPVTSQDRAEGQS